METHLKGYMGNILRVNLTTKQVSIEPLPEDLIKLYIGGRGMGAKILYDELAVGIEPLSPENKMIFSSGPLTNTVAQSCSRWFVTTKSPMTGAIIRSCAGGGLAAEIKSAGFDILIVEGRADKPSYLSIDDGNVEIRDGAKFVGLFCSEATSAIRQELDNKKVKVATVGPAAEKMVELSGIYDDERIAARGGVGTVMWSKNLKAIAVHGTKKVEIADRDALLEITKAQVKEVKTNPKFQAFAHMGTATGVAPCHGLGIYPVKNFQEGILGGVENLFVDKVEEYFVKDARCHRCHIRCGRILKVAKGPYAGKEVKGPEYEAMYSFGGMVGCDSLEMIVEVNRICDEYCVDTISVGSTIAFAMELFERGILTKEDVDGMDLTWGNQEAVIELVKKIVKREGFGDILADGTKKAAERIGKGSEKYAIHVKGLELPGYDPRALKAAGLNLATSPFGATHVTGQAPQEMMPKGTPGAIDRFSAEGKGPICMFNQDTIAIYETGIYCIFPKSIGLVDVKAFGQMFLAATGIEEFADEEYLYKVGERLWNLERAFNTREGFSRRDDYLPERFIKESVKNGPIKGQIYEMDQMLDDYYEARGWDKDTGVATRKKLESLDLKFVADDLEKMGKLPS